MKRKVKITKAPAPVMAYGGQKNFALDIYSAANSAFFANTAADSVRSTIKESPRDESNIEAEKGETIIIPSQDGYNHFDIGGKKHYNGGTPLNVPDGSFVFSDRKNLQVSGAVLSMFGKSEDTKKKYTPAELAKQYDLNKYKAILNDKESDKISKRTAEIMIGNNSNKLGQIALLQEAKKGFPQGIPSIAAPLLQTQGVPQDNMEISGQSFAAGGTAWTYDPKNLTQQFLPPVYPVTPSAAPVATDPIVNNQSAAKYGFSDADKLGIANSLIDYGNIKKYMPWAPVVNLATPQLQQMDPSRALAANSEQAAIAAQANSTLGGAASRYRNSEIYGKATENAANIAGQYANQNTQIANQQSQISAQVANQQAGMNAQRAQQLYNDTVQTNAQYDVEERLARKQVLGSYTQAQRNAADVYNLNKTSPYFAYNPSTGTMQFLSGKHLESYMADRSGQSNVGSFDQWYQEALKNGFKEDDARRMAWEKAYGGKDVTTTTVTQGNKRTQTKATR